MVTKRLVSVLACGLFAAVLGGCAGSYWGSYVPDPKFPKLALAPDDEQQGAAQEATEKPDCVLVGGSKYCKERVVPSVRRGTDRWAKKYYCAEPHTWVKVSEEVSICAPTGSGKRFVPSNTTVIQSPCLMSWWGCGGWGLGASYGVPYSVQQTPQTQQTELEELKNLRLQNQKLMELLQKK